MIEVISNWKELCYILKENIRKMLLEIMFSYQIVYHQIAMLCIKVQLSFKGNHGGMMIGKHFLLSWLYLWHKSITLLFYVFPVEKWKNNERKQLRSKIFQASCFSLTSLCLSILFLYFYFHRSDWMQIPTINLWKNTIIGSKKELDYRHSNLGIRVWKISQQITWKCMKVLLTNIDILVEHIFSGPDINFIEYNSLKRWIIIHIVSKF